MGVCQANQCFILIGFQELSSTDSAIIALSTRLEHHSIRDICADVSSSSRSRPLGRDHFSNITSGKFWLQYKVGCFVFIFLSALGPSRGLLPTIARYHLGVPRVRNDRTSSEISLRSQSLGIGDYD